MLRSNVEVICFDCLYESLVLCGALRVYSTGLPAKIHGFFYQFMPFYAIFYAIFFAIFYAILCHSLMEFMLFHTTFSSVSCNTMLANRYIIIFIIILSSEYEYESSKYHISMISLSQFYHYPLKDKILIEIFLAPDIYAVLCSFILNRYILHQFNKIYA